MVGAFIGEVVHHHASDAVNGDGAEVLVLSIEVLRKAPGRKILSLITTR